MLFLQPLITLVTWSLVNHSVSSRDIRLTSFDIWRVLLDEECLPRFEVVNRRLKMLAISLGEVLGLPAKVMPSLAAVCLDLLVIPLIVRYNLVLSVLWSMLSTNSLQCLLLWSDVALVISSFIVDSRGEAGSCSRRSSRSSIMARISVGACCVYSFRLLVGIWWEAVFNSVGRDNFSSFWQSVLSLACIGSSQPSWGWCRLCAGRDIYVVPDPIVFALALVTSVEYTITDELNDMITYLKTEVSSQYKHAASFKGWGFVWSFSNQEAILMSRHTARFVCFP